MEASEATRVRQGASASTSPDVLRALASDPSVTVRASLAMNPALPEQVSAMLASDTDARVRAILGRKLSMLAPALDDEERQRMQRDAVANLTAMVADAGLRVRISIADTVKDLADGPRDIVLRLAHDPAVMVCEPVIRFSPMLTQEDLIALIATRPPVSTILAVANRPKIDAAVSDAVVGTNDSPAICALLANPTAQIRETTLDSLAAQSEEHTDWQAPLVRRPRLSPRAQRMLAEIVGGHLLDTLRSRTDLDPKVKQMLQKTLVEPPPEQLGAKPATFRAAAAKAPPAAEAAKAPLAAAAAKAPLTAAEAAKAPAAAVTENGRTAPAAGTGDDAAILDALRRNALRDASALLAASAHVPVTVIARVCALRSAKGVVSLAWKAGLAVQTSVVLQVALAQLPPDEVLRPGKDGAFPLSEDEMRWQLAFLDVPDREVRAWTPRRLTQ